MDYLKYYMENFNQKMSLNDESVKKYVLENWEELEQLSEISSNAYVSNATVSRYFKKMRFRGFKHFMKVKDDSQKISKDYKELFSQIAKQKSKLINDTKILNDSEILNECAIKLSDSEIIYLIGHGYSKVEAELLRMRLLRIGFEAIYIENIKDIPFMRSKNNLNKACCLALSQSGQTTEVNKILDYFYTNGAYTIVITSEGNESLKKYAHSTLSVPKVCSSYLLETLYSEVTVNYIFDCLYAVVLINNYEKSIKEYNKSIELVE